MLFIGTYRPIAATITGRNAELFNEIYTDLDATELELNEGINVAEYVAQHYAPQIRFLFPINSLPVSRK